MLDTFRMLKKQAPAQALATTITKIERPILFGWFAVIGAALIWIVSLQGVDPYDMNNLGLLSVLRPAYYVALGILIVSVCVMIYQQKVPEYLFLLHISLLILILHATPPLLYGTLRYSWAWKHVGVVDYIQRYGVVNPNETYLDAYHNWPGFFSLNALLVEVAGLENPLVYAPWAQIFFNLLGMGALLLILKSCTQDRRLVWLGIWFYFLTSWVGQDYFAPQAMGYLLYLVIIGICLHWFGGTLSVSKPSIKRWLRFDWLVDLFHKAFSFHPMRAIFGAEHPLQRVGLMMIIVLHFVVIASSHQFTPIMTVSAFVLLILFRCCTIRSLPMLITVLTMLWIVYIAVIFLHGEIENIVESFGQVSENVGSNLISLSTVSPEQQLVSRMGRLLTGGLWALAALGMLRQILQGDWNLSVALLTVSPFFMLLGNAYGGEVLFRSYLFSLPFMAFLVGALLLPNARSGKSWLTMVITIVISVAFLVGFLFAYYGKDRQYYFTEEEIKASEYLYKFASENSLLIEGSRNYPGQFENYEIFTYIPLSRENPEVHQRMLANPVAFFERWMDNDRYTRSYLLITRSHKIEVEMLGGMPPKALDIIEQALLESPRFRVVFQNRDARVFVLADVEDEDD